MDPAELPTWIRKHQRTGTAAIMRFEPRSRNIDKTLNDNCHGMLLRMMTEKKTVSAPPFIITIVCN